MELNQRTWSDVVSNKDRRNVSQKTQLYGNEPGSLGEGTGVPVPNPQLATNIQGSSRGQVVAHMSDLMLGSTIPFDRYDYQHGFCVEDTDMLDLGDPGNFERPDYFDSNDDLYPGTELSQATQMSHPNVVIQDEQGRYRREADDVQYSHYPDAYSLDDISQRAAISPSSTLTINAVDQGGNPPGAENMGIRSGVGTGPYAWSNHAMHPIAQGGQPAGHTMDAMGNSGSQLSWTQQHSSYIDTGTPATSFLQNATGLWDAQGPQPRALPFHIKTQGFAPSSKDRKSYAHVVRDGPVQGVPDQTRLSPRWDTRYACQARPMCDGY